jgi:hypothetical protein
VSSSTGVRALLAATCAFGALAVASAAASARPAPFLVRTHTGNHRTVLGLVCRPKQLECKGTLSPFDFARAQSRVPTLHLHGREVVHFTFGFKPAGATLTAYKTGNRVVATTYLPHTRKSSWQLPYPAALSGRGVIVVVTAITGSRYRYAYGVRFVN